MTALKKMTALLLVVLTLCSILTVNVSAASYTCTKSLSELQTLYPDGKYWNHIGRSSWDICTVTDKPCTTTHRHGSCGYSGSCGCNSFFGLCSQCMGFAYTLQYVAFNGFNGYYAAEERNYDRAMRNLKPGDVIRYGGHSIFVTAVNGDSITYMDCNKSGTCNIRHNVVTTKSAVKGSFSYVSPAPCALTTGGGAVPNPSSFSANFRLCSGAYTNAYTGVNGAYCGRVYPGDVVTVQEVFSNGWMRVSCPWTGWAGGYRTVYVRISEFKFRATKYINAYDSAGGSKVGRAYPQDLCPLGEIPSSGWLRCQCPWTGGVMKTIWLKTSEIYG